MERLELKQKTLFEKRTFEIKDNAFEMNTRKISENTNLCVEFDRFTLITRKYTESKPIFFKIGLIAIIIAILQLLSFNARFMPAVGFFMIVGVFFLILYKVTMKLNLLYELDNNTQLFLFFNNPNKSEFNEFIETLNSKLVNYFKDTYFHIDPNKEPVNNINTMRWLKERNVISENEYKDIVNEINNKQNRPIGFQG